MERMLTTDSKEWLFVPQNGMIHDNRIAGGACNPIVIYDRNFAKSKFYRWKYVKKGRQQYGERIKI